MPLSDSGTWQVRSAVAWQDQVRAELDARLTAAGLPPGDYEGTVLGALAFVLAWLAWRVDQSVAEALSALTLATADAAVVRQLAADRGLRQRPGLPTRVNVVAVGPGVGPTLDPGLPPIGSTWRITTGGAILIDQATGAQTFVTDSVIWRRISDPAWEQSTFGRITIEADLVGTVIVVLPGAFFSPVDPLPGFTQLIYDDGSGHQQFPGRDPETAAELRQRVAAARSAPSGTPTGIRAALLGLPEVLFASVAEPAAGQISVSVALLPQPLADVTAAAEVYRRKAAGAETVGPTAVSIVDDDGEPRTVRLAIGGTETVVVSATLVSDGTVASADLVAAVIASVRDYGATLGPGSVVRYALVYRACVVPGVRGLTLTLNAGTSDVTPANPANFPQLQVAAGVAP